MPRYEIYADEAWTHQSLPLRRYWCFYGGIFGTESDLGRLDTALRKVATTSGLGDEVKWSKVTPNNVARYRTFVDCLFAEIERGSVRWRQMFCDRSLVRVPSPGEEPVSDLDVQFKLCYQFLKHSFGLEYLDQSVDSEVLVRLDTHSSQKHKAALATADSAHRERQDRAIVSTQIGDRGHRSERSDVSWWRCCSGSVSSPLSFGTVPSA